MFSSFQFEGLILNIELSQQNHSKFCNYAVLDTGNSLKNIHSMSHEGTCHCNNNEIGINHESPKFFLSSFAFSSQQN